MSSPSLQVRLEVQRSGRGQEFSLEVEFEAKPGITILFGPSGSGKSTILQAVAGLFRPQSGEIALGEKRWTHTKEKLFLPPEKRKVAYVFQSLALFPHLTAIKNVCYGMPKALSKMDKEKEALSLLERVGVSHLAGRKPKTFSGGEAQRVALARALASRPEVLLLDEPFSALDRDLRIQLATLVVELVDELQIPTLQVTHNHGEAKAMGQRMLKMKSGRIIEDSPIVRLPEALLEDS